LLRARRRAGRGRARVPPPAPPRRRGHARGLPRGLGARLVRARPLGVEPQRRGRLRRGVPRLRRKSRSPVTPPFPSATDALVLALALALDVVLGEPPNALHPVVWMGNVISALERRAPRAQRSLQLAWGTLVAAL